MCYSCKHALSSLALLLPLQQESENSVQILCQLCSDRVSALFRSQHPDVLLQSQKTWTAQAAAAVGAAPAKRQNRPCKDTHQQCFMCHSCSLLLQLIGIVFHTCMLHGTLLCAHCFTQSLRPPRQAAALTLCYCDSRKILVVTSA